LSVCHTTDSKPVKQEVNGTVILPPLVFPALSIIFNQTYVVPILLVMSVPLLVVTGLV
jgi:hypothetical protein